MRRSSLILIVDMFFICILILSTSILIYYSVKFLNESEKYPLIEVKNNIVTINSTKIKLWLYSACLIILAGIGLLALILLACCVVDAILNRDLYEVVTW